MTDLAEATYEVDGGYQIHLKSAGEGPVVVFVHGSGPGASGASNFRQPPQTARSASDRRTQGWC